MTNYQKKYLKYKNKYLNITNKTIKKHKQKGGSDILLYLGGLSIIGILGWILFKNPLNKKYTEEAIDFDTPSKDIISNPGIFYEDISSKNKISDDKISYDKISYDKINNKTDKDDIYNNDDNDDNDDNNDIYENIKVKKIRLNVKNCIFRICHIYDIYKLTNDYEVRKLGIEEYNKNTYNKSDIDNEFDKNIDNEFDKIKKGRINVGDIDYVRYMIEEDRKKYGSDDNFKACPMWFTSPEIAEAIQGEGFDTIILEDSKVYDESLENKKIHGVSYAIKGKIEVKCWLRFDDKKHSYYDEKKLVNYYHYRTEKNDFLKIILDFS